MRSSILSWLLPVCLLVLTQAPVTASALDLNAEFDADGFSAVINTDHYHLNGDALGHVQVGNNASYTNFSVGYSNLDGTEHEVAGRNAYYGNSFQFNNLNGISRITGAPINALPRDYAFFSSLSSTWSGYAESSEVAYSAIGGSRFISVDKSLTADSFILNINATDLNGVGEMSISLPEGSQLLLNISGGTSSAIDFGAMGFVISLGDQTLNTADVIGVDEALMALSNNIFFNFFEAEALNLHNLALPGSLLAPVADIFAWDGQLNGTLIAENLYSGLVPLGVENPENWFVLGDNAFILDGETPADGGFQINTPGTTPVPLPGTLALMGVGLVAFWARRRKA